MDDTEEGEILKAHAPGRDELAVGMPVNTIDGEFIGNIKELGDDAFLLDRRFARDLWVPYKAVLSTADYSGNFHGPVRQTVAVLEVSAAHVEAQGWRHG
jgi:hypothetical protein